jgi:hypothetical protein
MESRAIARSKDVTTNSPQRKAGTAGPRPWEIESYIHKKDPKDDNRSSHGDPRLEFAVQGHGQHQDDFTSSNDDVDHGSGYPAFGLGTTPDLESHVSSASDQGTLAGRLSGAPPRPVEQPVARMGEWVPEPLIARTRWRGLRATDHPHRAIGLGNPQTTGVIRGFHT